MKKAFTDEMLKLIYERDLLHFLEISVHWEIFVLMTDKLTFIFSKHSFGMKLCIWLSAEVAPVQFSHSVMSDSLWPHGHQHTRLPCPSPTPGAYSNSCPLRWWCHPTISSSVGLLFLLPSIFPQIRVFSNELVLCLRWPKHWSFSFSIIPSNEY